MPETVVVFAGGSPPSPRAAAAIPPRASAVAADGGADHALALGLQVELVVGDLDSITPAGLETLENGGARIERHPVGKEASDLELALAAAVAFQPRRILVVGGVEGRLDHLVGELLLLGADAFEGVELDALLGEATVHVVRRERVLAGMLGETISLFALHGPAAGVVTDGLVYPLHGETLVPGSSRGLSNVFAAAHARVALESGVLIAVRPGPDAGRTVSRRRA